MLRVILCVTERELVCISDIKNKKEAEELLAVFAKALHRSVKSEKVFLFRKQVESFIKTYSKELWGLEENKLLRLWDSLIRSKVE